MYCIKTPEHFLGCPTRYETDDLIEHLKKLGKTKEYIEVLISEFEKKNILHELTGISAFPNDSEFGFNLLGEVASGNYFSKIKIEFGYHYFKLL